MQVEDNRNCENPSLNLCIFIQDVYLYSRLIFKTYIECKKQIEPHFGILRFTTNHNQTREFLQYLAKKLSIRIDITI